MCNANRTRRALFVLIVASALGAGVRAQDARTEWTEAEVEKGYVVFRHDTLRPLPEAFVPARGAILNDWNEVRLELARGESESVFIGVHNITGPPLIDTWAEPTISAAAKLDVEVYYRNDEIHQLVPGKVIGRIPVGRTGGFWLTFSARPDTPVSDQHYRLEIIPANHNRKKTILQPKVRVRPFTLPRARASFAGYYALSIEGIPMGWARYMNNRRWRRACYENMAAYGMTSVDVRGLGSFYTETGGLLLGGETSTKYLNGLPWLQAEMPLGCDAGLLDPQTPVIVLEMPVPQDPQVLAEFAPKLVELQKASGWPELLIYTRDEPPYPAPDVRPRNLPFRNTPLRTVSSFSLHAAYGHGDVHDVWLVYGGHITPEMRAEAHRLGAEVWTYTCHISNGEPLKNRFYAGLYTWAQRAGGNWIWAYYRNSHHNRLVWSETADYRMCPGIGYENRRDGIDDCRYLQLLEDSIAARPDHAAAAEARGFLEALRARVLDADPHRAGPGAPLEFSEYNDIRARIADFIETIGPGPARDHRPWAEPGLKDEAAAFRAKTIDECIQGLAAADASLRRSAAWALFERGEDAAPAVPALANALDDPEVRMVALRVLEQLGAAAAPAGPAATGLLSRPDVFVRFGAVHVLKAIGESAIEGLRQALRDESVHVAYVASQAAAELGAAGNALTALLVRNLDRPRIPTTYGHYDGAIHAIIALAPHATPAIVDTVVNRLGRSDSKLPAGEHRQLVKYLEALGDNAGLAEKPVRALLGSGLAHESVIPALEKFLGEL